MQADVIVVGGGPAGAATAARLAALGRRVLLFEKERFPRFHVGESLLPCSMPLLAALGVLPALERFGFQPKYAAEFLTDDGALRQRYAFAEGLLEGATSALQVERATFDHVLLEHAKSQGVTVHEGSPVTGFSLDGDAGVTVNARAPDGSPLVAAAQLLVNASGQSTLVASRLGLRRMEPNLKNASLFAHFEGALRGEGRESGDTSIVLGNEGWWWVIPMKDDITSLGVVAPGRALAGAGEAFFEAGIARAPYLARRFAGARRVGPVRAASDWSYRSTALAGDRWLAAGDAGSFIDPIFSTGVHLALVSGLAAATAAHEALARGRFERSRFSGYERRMRRLFATYGELVRGFYTPELASLLLHPSDTLGLRRAVISLLAGHGADRPGVALRLAVFHRIVALNRRFSLVPRLGVRSGP